MTKTAYNVLTQSLVRVAPQDALSLPALLARLASDKVEEYPALRPHQDPAWHMFVVQLAALALHRAGRTETPEGTETWLELLRGLTPDYPDDEPWCLVVEDQDKPAFFQPPVLQGSKWSGFLATPDALDLLITSRNHDLKRAIARDAQPEDWIFALVSLQTGEGYGGRGNHGIARMNGGSSSRAMLGLAPLLHGQPGDIRLRPGARFRRDVETLLATRPAQLFQHKHLGYPDTGGLGLVWLRPWPEDQQLELKDLDIWFIEICRRVRLGNKNGAISGLCGTSKAARIDAKNYRGCVGDPWAPVHKTESKALTLSSNDFHYRKLTDLLLSGDWTVPLLARLGPKDPPKETLALIAQALSRGNSKTEGFKSRIIPMGGRIPRALGNRRAELHELANEQIKTIGAFDKALRNALVLIVVGGEREKVKKKHYDQTSDARARFDRAVDGVFFPHLWARFEAEGNNPEAIEKEKRRFAHALNEKAYRLFEAALPSILCTAIHRPRAEARARSRFKTEINKIPYVKEENANAVA